MILLSLSNFYQPQHTSHNSSFIFPNHMYSLATKKKNNNNSPWSEDIETGTKRRSNRRRRRRRWGSQQRARRCPTRRKCAAAVACRTRTDSWSASTALLPAFRRRTAAAREKDIVIAVRYVHRVARWNDCDSRSSFRAALVCRGEFAKGAERGLRWSGRKRKSVSMGSKDLLQAFTVGKWMGSGGLFVSRIFLWCWKGSAKKG